MYLKQTELFWGLNQNFIQSATAIATRESFDKDDCVFKANEPAIRFYVLIRGKIKLALPETEQVVYRSDCVGEIFGWSALLDRKTYSVSGFCEEPSVVLVYDQLRFRRLLEKDTESARIFFRQLACELGERLLSCYQLVGQPVSI